VKCKFCGSPLERAEHLPTDDCGTYIYACGTDLKNGQWDQSGRCRKDADAWLKEQESAQQQEKDHA
jgi:hypothetical protein